MHVEQIDTLPNGEHVDAPSTLACPAPTQPSAALLPPSAYTCAIALNTWHMLELSINCNCRCADPKPSQRAQRRGQHYVWPSIIGSQSEVARALISAKKCGADSVWGGARHLRGARPRPRRLGRPGSDIATSDRRPCLPTCGFFKTLEILKAPRFPALLRSWGARGRARRPSDGRGCVV